LGEISVRGRQLADTPVEQAFRPENEDDCVMVKS
jgi:hypothetical protein